MKSIIVFVFFTFGLFGCGKSSLDSAENKDYNYKEQYQIITIDSCEYIEKDSYNGIVLTHKGNCKNPIHKIKQ